MILYFILAVIGFFLFCSLIANFILAPLHKKYPKIMNGVFWADTIRFWSRLF
jgi:hypothetical protein